MRGWKQRGFQLLSLLAALALKQVLAGEDEGPTDTDVAIAATLLGAISFIMTLYYFTNFDDLDIQKYSWKTISDTISIFCAVLLFQSCNDLVEAYIIEPFFGEEEASLGALVVDMLHMLAWFGLMQYSLAKLSGALDDETLAKLEGEELEEEKEKREIDLKCFAVLLAHMTGFASINAFGTIQQFGFFKSPVTAFSAVLVGLVGQLGLQRLTDNFREGASKGDDGSKSEWEEMWDEETEEAENDVMGLTLSFLTVNAIRLTITGCLPNQEGKEEECHIEEYLYHHTMSQKLQLFFVGFVFTVIIAFLTFFWPESLEADAIERRKSLNDVAKANMKLFSRFCEGCYVAVSMCFSWSFFYGTQMILAGNSFLAGQSELMTVVLALVISLSSFALMVVFDKIADADSSKILDAGASPEKRKAFDEKVDKAIRALMSSLSLLVGFSWEQCFDASVDSLAEKTNDSELDIINPHTMKLMLSIFCAGLLVPAWKWYILPYIQSEGWEFGYLLNLPSLEKSKKQEMKEAVAKAKALIKSAKGKEETASADEGFKPLPGNASEALKRENKELQAQISMYKKMFAQHVESMSANFKKMDSTVKRLEEGQS